MKKNFVGTSYLTEQTISLNVLTNLEIRRGDEQLHTFTE